MNTSHAKHTSTRNGKSTWTNRIVPLVAAAIAAVCSVFPGTNEASGTAAPGLPLGDATMRRQAALRALDSVVVVEEPGRRKVARGIAIGPREVLTTSQLFEDIDGRYSTNPVVVAGKRRITAHYVGRDYGRDVALLRLSEPLDTWLPMQDHPPRTGEPFLVVTHWIRSALGPTLNPITVSGEPMFYRYRSRTRCVPFAGMVGYGPGFSPVVDLHGNLVGLTQYYDTFEGTDIRAGTGCFAPIGGVAESVAYIRAHGSVTYAELGVWVLGNGPLGGVAVRAPGLTGRTAMPDILIGRTFEILAIENVRGGLEAFRDYLRHVQVGDEVKLLIWNFRLGRTPIYVRIRHRTEGFPNHL